MLWPSWREVREGLARWGAVCFAEWLSVEFEGRPVAGFVRCAGWSDAEFGGRTARSPTTEPARSKVATPPFGKGFCSLGVEGTTAGSLDVVWLVPAAAPAARPLPTRPESVSPLLPTGRRPGPLMPPPTLEFLRLGAAEALVRSLRPAAVGVVLLFFPLALAAFA